MKDKLSKFGRYEYNPKLNIRSKTMSKNMTKAEAKIWFEVLANKQLCGFKFTKQKVVGNYILDFYCSELQLAIEVDGDSHAGGSAEEYDEIRTDFLEALGIKVVRFTNNEVLNCIECVKDELYRIFPKHTDSLLNS
jgi:very-short-patch-repair endonuclease